jgi:hypothetical protein
MKKKRVTKKKPSVTTETAPERRTTFVPLPTYTESAKVMTGSDLAACYMVGYKIHNGLAKPEELVPGTVEMWAGHKPALARYVNVLMEELVRRTGEPSLLPKLPDLQGHTHFPKWLGNEDFHRRQQQMMCWHHEYYASKFLGMKREWPDELDADPGDWHVAEAQQILAQASRRDEGEKEKS